MNRYAVAFLLIAVGSAACWFGGDRTWGLMILFGILIGS
jgi:hypothetical protein